MRFTQEHNRIKESEPGQVRWNQWGPYLSERAWGTVREDYSAYGTTWESLPHDHARSKAYRWGEDGLAGISDDKQYLCFALALWNGHDPILKERLFGLTGNEGNHGEDVKEYYFYLDNTPTHSYMKVLYKYPQRAFPYGLLVEENRRRGRNDFEYELLDTGICDDNRYFDVIVEYAKINPDDVLIRISASNRGAEAATLVLLPTIWFRNTWSWGYETGPMADVPQKPRLSLSGDGLLVAEHPVLGQYHLYNSRASEIVFTENETNNDRLYGVPNVSHFVKDAFHRYLIERDRNAVNSAQTGTKAAAIYSMQIAAGATEMISLRLSAAAHQQPFANFDQQFTQRIDEANEFYQVIHGKNLTEDQKRVQRQALAGMLWSKQLFYYDIEQWLVGDPIATPSDQRHSGRNHDWQHLNNFDIISMPDKWEYPWYAGWDLAFHCIPLAWLIQRSPKNSCYSLLVNGTCIRTGSSRLTSGHSVM